MSAVVVLMLAFVAACLVIGLPAALSAAFVAVIIAAAFMIGCVFGAKGWG